MTRGPRAFLILADGTVFAGRSIGAPGEAGGEVVFNTSLSGYQEVLTDPSYRGQIVVMTNPLIGNYGINAEDSESERPHLQGFVVRELSARVSNFRSTEALGDYLARHGVVAIEGVDTRAITRRIRVQGAMKGLISTEVEDPDELRARLEGVPELVGRDLVREVTRGQRLAWTEGYPSRFAPEIEAAPPRAARRPRVVVVDYGAKSNIFRSLVACGFDVSVVPATASASEVLDSAPDGVMLSNGPGDPRVLDRQIGAVRDVLGKVPLFGICLGHQILASAVGARIFKLKFGHHGGNHPVQEIATGRVEITAQNHGFAVDAASVAEAGGEVTHVNLNDETVEGMRFVGLRAMSVQYHPEAAPGPHDAIHLFRRFRDMVVTGEERC